MAVDYELYPYAEKSRRLFIELLELLVVSISTLFIFAAVTSNVIKNNQDYITAETNRISSRNDLFTVGKQSHLVVMYNDEHALDSYDMFVRFSYKCIHRSFELYPDDFYNEGFTSIKDPYNEPSISKDNDELLYFYTIYAPSKGLITSSDPLSYYRNNILDLDKHNNILVYSDDLECFILNNKTPNNGVEINFAVSLYKELYDDNKSFAMNAMYRLYTEYYDQANRMLEETEEYKIAYAKYESSSYETSRYISFGILITYLSMSLPYFMIVPMIRKDGNTPMRLFTHVELTDEDGEHLKWYKKTVYYFTKAVVSFFCVFPALYLAYGKNLFLSPFGVVGSFVIMPIHFVAITGILWMLLGLLTFIPVFNAQKTTPLEYLLGIRTADRRMDFEDKKEYKSKYKKGDAEK